MEQKNSLKHLGCCYFLLFLGIWLIASPWTFGYPEEILQKSDVVCGILLLVGGWQGRNSAKSWPYWVVCIVGLWLQMAPLLFWTKSPSAYLNDTFTGVLILLVGIIIPGIPGHTERKGREIPPGWSYNPSSWAQRMPVIALAIWGWLAARYLTAYQLGFITTMWDPWFGNGTVEVITSSISQAFPVPDAGMGALAYTLEALLGCKGGTARWRTMPWLVIGFGILVIPLGLISILLIVLQPIAVHAWCAICLMIALGMLIMIMLTVDEVTASLQVLRKGRHLGIAWSTLLWEGLPEAKEEVDTRSPSLTAPFYQLLQAAFWGCRCRWNMLLTAFLGSAAMMLPSFIVMPKWLADSDHICGALAVVLSILAMADITRVVRKALSLFGLFMVVVSCMYYSEAHILVPHLLIGIGWLIFCWPEGKVVERYGTTPS